MSLRIFKISFFLFILFFLIITNAYSTIYYVSQSGNDNNNGTSPGASWQTIAKVNSMMASINAGDQILFNKGDRFEGGIVITKSGTSGNEIVFGSYGTGALPEICGSKNITGWVLYSGNTYSANFNDTLSNFYAKNKLMTIARYPNSGWLRIDNPNGKNGFHDASLNQINGYWNNANCRLRTTNWCYETRLISNYNSGNVTFATQTQFNTNVGYGYYLDNKLSLLDTAGEFFYDKVSKIIYFNSPGGVDPNLLNAEGSVFRWGFYFNPGVSYIKIQDLKIIKFKEKAIKIPNGNFNTVKDCNISQNGITGVEMHGIGNVVNNNVLEDNLDRGISVSITNGAITNNRINRTGLIAGYGADSWGYIGLTVESSMGTIISNNVVDSSGYTGMRLSGDNIAENNIIEWSLLTLNDGGGIAFDFADGLIVRNNIIMNSIGNIESAPYSNYVIAIGIVFGSSTIRNTTVRNNTIAFNRTVGIYVDHTVESDHNQILNNILYDNFVTQMVFSDFSTTVHRPSYEYIIKGNIIYSLNWKQMGIEQQMFHSLTFSDFGVFDSNYYCNPYSEYVIKRTIMPPDYSSKEYRLGQWKTETGNDINSSFSEFTFDQFKVVDTIGNNFINNSKFTNNLNGWATWPSGSSIAHVINPLLDTGSMRVRWNGTGFTENFVTSNTFPVVKGDHYLFNVSVVGNHRGEFTAWALPSLPGTFNLGFVRKYGYENYRNNYSYIFQADTTDPSTKISVGMTLPDSLFYADNINLYKVNVLRIDSTEKSKLFINKTSSNQSISLNGITYIDLDGNVVTGSISLPPFSSCILINDSSVIEKKL